MVTAVVDVERCLLAIGGKLHFDNAALRPRIRRTARRLPNRTAND
jgi:hypothetical protein